MAKTNRERARHTTDTNMSGNYSPVRQAVTILTYSPKRAPPRVGLKKCIPAKNAAAA